jgi:hypothetical protein
MFAHIVRIANPWIRCPLVMVWFPFILAELACHTFKRGPARLFEYDWWELNWWCAFWVAFEGEFVGTEITR